MRFRTNFLSNGTLHSRFFFPILHHKIKNMAKSDLTEGQEYLSFNDGDLIVVEDFEIGQTVRGCRTTYSVILLVTSGKMQIECDGHSVVATPGDILVIGKGTIVGNYLFAPGSHFSLIAVLSSIAEGIHVVSKRMYTELYHIKSRYVFHLSDEDRALFKRHLDMLTLWMRKPIHEYYQDIVRLELGALILLIVELFHRDEKQGKSVEPLPAHGNTIAREFILMVEASEGRVRKVETYAERLCITPKYLSLLVRRAVGKKPIDIIRAFTIQTIRQRLLYTDMTVKEIANEMNFPNSSFFGKYFKESEGITPLEYREKFR